MANLIVSPRTKPIEPTRLLNGRFGKAAEQTGHAGPAFRLAGVHAMAALADDSGTVFGNLTLDFPAWTRSPTNVPNDRASYRVNFFIMWSDSTSGRLSAFTGILPSTYSDDRCATTFFPCTP